MGKAPPPISRSMAIDDSWIRSQPRCRKQSRIRYGAKVRKAVFNGKLYEHTEIVGIAWFVAIFSFSDSLIPPERGLLWSEAHPIITRRAHV